MSEKRIYEIVSASGRQRIEIPDDWKVTYGPVSPGKASYGGNALRLYESETKQRAIFTDVISFRDLSIPVKVLAIREKGKEKWESDERGRKRSSSVEIERAWIDESDLESPQASDEVPF